MAAGLFRRGQLLSDDSWSTISSAWEKAIAENPTSPIVTFNAADFLAGTDPERALDLLQRAKALDPPHKQKYNTAITSIYTAAEIQAIHPDGQLNNIRINDETALRLRAALENSYDPTLLAKVGQLMAELRRQPEPDQQLKRGLELIQQAISLDPSNPAWKEALASAQSAPQRRLNEERAFHTGTPQPGTVRIGSAVAEASLVTKVDPVYPPLARQARIQGVVEFTITVGIDGKVEKIELVRGHPLMVEAAKEAVKQWVYHPASINGRAIPFITEVMVPFRLDEPTKPLLADPPRFPQ